MYEPISNKSQPIFQTEMKISVSSKLAK